MALDRPKFCFGHQVKISDRFIFLRNNQSWCPNEVFLKILPTVLVPSCKMWWIIFLSTELVPLKSTKHHFGFDKAALLSKILLCRYAIFSELGTNEFLDKHQSLKHQYFLSNHDLYFFRQWCSHPSGHQKFLSNLCFISV